MEKLLQKQQMVNLGNYIKVKNKFEFLLLLNYF